ncbi:MAG TPA: protoheme IX farnesyltransferase [Rhizobiales bacterium]|nr:protoheme IX farnesyltransferase [Hyphomicrobiales bacterium]
MTDINAQATALSPGRPLARLAGDGSVGDYFALLKPRVMSLVVFTAFVGMVAAPGSQHPWMAAISLLMIAVGAGASGALNMWYDADIDARMKRTQNRPVPSGAISPGDALGFGLVLSVGSVLMFGTLVNWFAAGLLAFTIFFYAVIYTMWLKRSTPYNIVIGGAAGAFPPMVGWAAVTGGIDLVSISLFLIIFFWTPPHFWALCLFRTGDYQRAGVPMLPVAAGIGETCRQIWRYSLLLVPVTCLPVLLGAAGPLYLATVSLLNAGFLFFAWRIYAAKSDNSLGNAPKQLFSFSILYLFAVFSAILAEKAFSVAPYQGLGF